MTTKTTLTSFIAAAACVIGTVAMAQTAVVPADQAPTSTPGAGCTATGNAMRGGNMGGDASATACAPKAKGIAATPSTTSTPAVVGSTSSPATVAPSYSGSTASTASTDTTTASNQPAPAKTRVAKADRN